MELNFIKTNGQNEITVVQRKLHPHKLMLWIALSSITMVFVALTSALVVRKSTGYWQGFQLPDLFLYNTLIIFISSITIQGAYVAAKKNIASRLSYLLAATFILGIGFLIAQLFAWKHLISEQIYFSDLTSVSGSFVYILSGLHGFHIIGGLIALLVMWIRAVGKKINSEKIVGLELTTTYWHFVDGLWIYLYLFLLLNYQ